MTTLLGAGMTLFDVDAAESAFVYVSDAGNVKQEAVEVWNETERLVA